MTEATKRLGQCRLNSELHVGIHKENGCVMFTAAPTELIANNHDRLLADNKRLREFSQLVEIEVADWKHAAEYHKAERENRLTVAYLEAHIKRFEALIAGNCPVVGWQHLPLPECPHTHIEATDDKNDG